RPESSTRSVATLFSGERTGNHHCRRGSSATFRRPEFSSAKPHERPVFLVSENGVDPKDCVDIHNPRRFSSLERVFAQRGIRHLDPLVRPPSASSRPSSASSSLSSRNEWMPVPAFRPVTAGGF
ncbi:Hypothetical protein SCF082_LOCUS51836, partial [Durusdinium trenchii]